MSTDFLKTIRALLGDKNESKHIIHHDQSQIETSTHKWASKGDGSFWIYKDTNYTQLWSRVLCAIADPTLKQEDIVYIMNGLCEVLDNLDYNKRKVASGKFTSNTA